MPPGFNSSCFQDMETTNSITTNQFAKALIQAGCAFSITESSEFKKFISRLTNKWKMPSRGDLSAVYIPKPQEISTESVIVDTLSQTERTDELIDFELVTN